MDILEQKHRLVTIAIITVVLTGIIIAVAASAPLIHEVHTLTSRLAANVADTKAENIRTIFDKHQDLAHQTASRSELAWSLERYADGRLTAGELKRFSRPRLQDAAHRIENLAAIVRYDASGNEIVRVGPWASALPDTLSLPEKLDIRAYTLADDEKSPPLLHTASGIRGSEPDRTVGHDLLIFTPEPLQAVFRSFNHGILCLVDETYNRKVALDPDTRKLAITRPDCLPPGTDTRGLNEQGYLTLTTDEGARALMFRRSLGDYGWLVHIRSDVSEVFAGVFHIIVITGLIILLLSVISALVMRRALSPLLHALVDQAAQIVRSTEELRLAYSAFEYTHEVVAITDVSFNIVRANPAFAEISGMPPRRLIGKSLVDFLDNRPGRVPALKTLQKQLDARGVWHGEVGLKGTGDEPLPCLLTVSPVRDPQGELQHFVLTFTNIADRVEAEKQMHRLAHYDRLTGLPNRTALDNHLGKAIQKARGSGDIFALMFLDLDHFKPVNDNYGHQVGDELLVNVAKRLSRCLRSCDIVGRQGGDEFVIITGPLSTAEDGRVIAEKTIAVLREVFHIRGHELRIGVSVGVALYPRDGETAEALYEKADRAMYRVKTQGRNNAAFAS